MSTPSNIDLTTPIQYLKGVGPARSQALASLGVATVEDLLYTIPRRYVDRSTLVPLHQLAANTQATVIGRVVKAEVKHRRRTLFTVILADDHGRLTCQWFSGYRYLQHVFHENDLVIASGKVTFYHGFVMSHPDYEILGDDDPGEEESLHMGRIIPLYPSTAELARIRLGSKVMRRLVHTALERTAGALREILPPAMPAAQGLMPLPDALRQVHFPDDETRGAAARRRLSFDEFFFMELLLALKRHSLQAETRTVPETPGPPLVGPFIASLPFPLTPAQQRVIDEILADLNGPHTMNRLLQGDVGSGKTVVAICALLKAVEQGRQAALMAPTEVLAEQHFLTLHRLLDTMRLNVSLLVGGTAVDQRETLAGLATGRTHVVVGTHALFMPGVRFKDLGLVVIDEQHKFGVMQRTALSQKGRTPDVLVMTATPIPRTLSLTVYGDLDVSVIDALPPGRTPVTTVRRTEKDHPAIYHFIDEQVRQGRQAYIVYPLIEESEKIDLESAIKNYERLRTAVFPQHACGLLHGRLPGEEKERAITAFKEGRTKILVATTVVEVGVDVPNATVMLIEHAERFGLAQLHQLRGRIGRGAEKSYCVLCVKPPLSAEAQQRLQAVTGTTDGFKIAELDLAIRGPGEFLGTRQSGLPDLKIANILTDPKLLVAAREEAFRVVKDDPALARPAHAPVRSHLMRKYRDKLELLKTG